MNEKLVVYYSFEGNTKFVAETIAREIGADLLELKPKKEMKGHGFSKFIWGGRQVMLKIKPELEPLAKNPADYDLIFIGTPVWAYTFTPPLRSFFSQVKLQNKKIALFCTHEGNPGKIFEHMKKELSGNEIIGQQGFKDALKEKDRNLADIKNWIKELSALINY